MPLTPPFTFTRSSARAISLFTIVNQATEVTSKPVVYKPLSPTRFKNLLHRYKRAVLERHYRYWQESDLNTALFITPFAPNRSNPMSPEYYSSVADIHRDARWVINEWHINFLFSEQMLVSIKHRSKVPNWYEDVDVAMEYMAQLDICFNSINAFHKSFGSLPGIGDRLFNEDMGLLIKDRIIDGRERTVTFVLSR